MSLLIFHLLNQKVHLIGTCLVWKQKFAFVIDKCFNFFKCYQATTFPKQVTNATKIWIGYKVNLLLTQKWEENIPKFYFCIRAPMFSTHMPCPFKICFTKKVNTICGGGQLLVTGFQGPITRIPGVRITCLRVTSPKTQGPSSRVPSLEVPGPSPSSQVLILDYAQGLRVPSLRSWF